MAGDGAVAVMDAEARAAALTSGSKGHSMLGQIGSIAKIEVEGSWIFAIVRSVRSKGMSGAEAFGDEGDLLYIDMDFVGQSEESSDGSGNITVNRGISDGIGVTRAVLRAGELRFRAVTLTSITTVMGLLPILLERSSQAESVKPMAVSLGFGLLFATGLTLFVVPAAFMLLNDVRRFARWLRYGGAYPRPELVEDPASVTASRSNG